MLNTCHPNMRHIDPVYRDCYTTSIESDVALETVFSIFMSEWEPTYVQQVYAASWDL